MNTEKSSADLTGIKERNRSARVGEKNVETVKKILPAQKIKTDTELTGEADRSLEPALADLYRQPMKVNRDRVSIPHRRKNLSTPREIQSDTVSLKRKKIEMEAPEST